MAPCVREVQIEMRRTRELLRRALGVSISADVSEVVHFLLKGSRELEQKCPKLMCHLRVSGDSESNGQSFLVVLHDRALDNNRAARPAVNSVYTHLHSEASMATTSALWLAFISGRPSTTPGAGVANGPPSTPPTPAPSTLHNIAAAETAAGAGSEQGGVDRDGPDNGQGAGAPPAASSGDLLAVGGGAGPQPGGKTRTPAPGTNAPSAPADPLMDLSAGSRAPAVHAPTSAACKLMEALFTARKSG